MAVKWMAEKRLRVAGDQLIMNNKPMSSPIVLEFQSDPPQ